MDFTSLPFIFMFLSIFLSIYLIVPPKVRLPILGSLGIGVALRHM